MRRFGKKLVAVVLATTLMAAMGMTAFAAGSAENNGVVTEITGATDKNGNKVEVTVKEMPAEYKEAAEEVKNVDTVKKVLGDAFVEGMRVVDVQDVVVADPSAVEWPLTITFAVPGVVEGTKVAVLHYENGTWVSVPCKAGKGTITATFNSLSPVAFVVDKNTEAPEAPKTGESAVVVMAGLVAIIAAAGVVVFRKRNIAR